MIDVERNYEGSEALGPGRDATLDHICAYLLEEKPLFDSPSDSDRARSVAEEDGFLEWMEKTPDCLRDRNYERLLPVRRRIRGLGRVTKRVVGKIPFGAGGALLQAGRGLYRSFAR